MSLLDVAGAAVKSLKLIGLRRKKRTYKLNNIMLYSIYISYFKYNIYFQLGRLGVKKIFDIKSD